MPIVNEKKNRYYEIWFDQGPKREAGYYCTSSEGDFNRRVGQLEKAGIDYDYQTFTK